MLADFMELSPSWEAAGCSATQEFPIILRNHVHRSPPLVSILSQINLIHTIPSHLSKIHFISSTHLRLGLLSGSYRLTIHQDPVFTSFPLIRATWLAHFILIDLTILVILGEEYNVLILKIVLTKPIAVAWTVFALSNTEIVGSNLTRCMDVCVILLCSRFRTDHATPLYPQTLALTSPTSGGRSVGIVRSRTKATELVLLLPSLAWSQAVRAAV
jgi:hypothetical protein